MQRQFLEASAAGSATEVVRRLCGVQAQLASAADLAVGVRLAQPVPAPTAGPLRARSLIRTWAMRGTLHLLPADAAGAYLSLIAAVRSWERPSWQRTFASATQLEALAEAARELLDGRLVSRDELIAEVVRRTADAGLGEQLRSSWSAVLKPLAWQGLLCQGPASGGRVTFTSPRTWAAGWGGIPPPEEAARVVIPAYLAVYGPGTMDAFDAWLTRGLSGRRALRGWFAAVEDLLVRVEVEGVRALAREEDVDEIARTRPSRTLRLLPAFDQYVLGPGTGDARVIPPAHRAAVSRAAGWIAPVVLAGGRVVGTWEIRDDRTLQIALFDGRPDAIGALDAEVDRLGRVLGKTLVPSLRVGGR
jgi:hypothetical protein